MCSAKNLFHALRDDKDPGTPKIFFFNQFPSRRANMETCPGDFSISSIENKWRLYLSWFAEDIRNHCSLPLKIFFPLLIFCFFIQIQPSSRSLLITRLFADITWISFSWPSLLCISVFYVSFLRCLKHTVFKLLFYFSLYSWKICSGAI